MEQELPRLVRKSQKGDREAFTQLLLECEQMLSRVAMAILRDPEDAADAVQDAVLAAWESLGQLRQPRYFKTWLVRILRNKCYRIGALRNKHSHTQLEEALRGEESPDWDRMLDVNAALGSLAGQDAAGAVLLRWPLGSGDCPGPGSQRGLRPPAAAPGKKAVSNRLFREGGALP